MIKALGSHRLLTMLMPGCPVPGAEEVIDLLIRQGAPVDEKDKVGNARPQ
jgi:D-ribose pyranose/furanose isomerase RbsD